MSSCHKGIVKFVNCDIEKTVLLPENYNPNTILKKLLPTIHEIRK